MNSPRRLWLATLVLAAPLAYSFQTGCGGGGGSGGSGGTGGATTTSTTTITTTPTTTTTTSTSTTSTSTTSTSTTSTTSTSSTTSTCPASTGTPPANTTCATAEAHTLAVGGATLTVKATTVGASANYPYCLNPPVMNMASPDVVYALTLSGAGTLNLTVTPDTGSTLVPQLDIRTNCANNSNYCVNSGDISQDLAAGTYYVIVSGQTCTAGSFTLTADLAAQVCGNGVVDPGEDCDPGMNPPANDGCGAPGTANQCKFIPQPVGEDKCPGQALAVPVGMTVLPASMGMSTYGFVDDYAGSCNQGMAPPNGGLDRVFQLTPAASGTLTVSVGYDVDGVTPSCPLSNQNGPFCWASMIYARTTCATASTEIANTCVLGVSGTNVVPAQMSFPVTANTPYWVFVDGYDKQNYSYGPFNFIVKLQ